MATADPNPDEKKVAQKRRGRPPKSRFRKPAPPDAQIMEGSKSEDMKRLEPGFTYQIDSNSTEKLPISSCAHINIHADHKVRISDKQAEARAVLKPDKPKVEQKLVAQARTGNETTEKALNGNILGKRGPQRDVSQGIEAFI